MKVIRIIFSLIIILQSSLMSADDYIMEVGQFEKLKINSDINLVYSNHPDSTGYARYTAPSGNNGLFLLINKGKGILRVQSAQTQWEPNELPTLYVYSDFLTSVESSSNQNVLLQNLVACASFSVNLIGNGTVIVDNIKCNNFSAAITTGSGTINASGSCINASFRMVGAGLISADRLEAENVKCSILGTGSIGCWPIDNLSIKGIGSTKIYYKGHPNIKKTGGGKIYELPEENRDRTGVKIDSFKEANEVLIESEETDENLDPDEEDEGIQTIVTNND